MRPGLKLSFQLKPTLLLADRFLTLNMLKTVISTGLKPASWYEISLKGIRLTIKTHSL
jgi:hypothetical protein